ncbi:hypothetical protein PN498_17815 [Oscillatoria sp. CS-180]|uniref:protein NO VEIN domain-containing protein n=1 Tax=Oscillatoria sp. CS-180 TaxID=3021720 RepID=UPI00232F3DF0|nr:DUF3883 domain-containing protein [Oscillatoria sp. CS-180]MDB9527857.1 hypothetical protein [Oscillatoria sp. CS-180]
MMRPIAELLDFLENQMSMQAVYQPVVILHLLTHGGFATRTDLARTLGGYDEVGLEHWDRILMKNPKLTLVDTHEILDYDKTRQAFTLPFDLSDTEAVTQAQTICEEAILSWIQRRLASGSLDEPETLRHYRVLELAKRGEQYQQFHSPAEADDIAVEEFAMRMAVTHLQQQYPEAKITQQPYNTPGFDVIVGSATEPIAFVKVIGTQKLAPSFTLSEGDRQFSIDNNDRYLLALVYEINLHQETYQFKIYRGAIKANSFLLVPLQWQVKCLPES